ATVNHSVPARVDRVEWIRPMGPRAWDTSHVNVVRTNIANVPAMVAQGPALVPPHMACEIAEKIIRTPSISHGGTSTASLVKMDTISGASPGLRRPDPLAVAQKRMSDLAKADQAAITTLLLRGPIGG